jgi:hypothetical protein
LAVYNRHEDDSAITKVFITVTAGMEIDSLSMVIKYVFSDNLIPESYNSVSSLGLSLELVTGARSQKFRKTRLNKWQKFLMTQNQLFHIKEYVNL